MARICVVGAGYVGLVTGACFAELGNSVVCLDIDAAKIERLRRGELPIFEPGLEELVMRNAERGRLTFTTDYAEAVPGARFAFIAVNTPSGMEGEADMSYVRAAAHGIGQHTPAAPADRRQQEHHADRHRRLDRRASSARRHGPGARFASCRNPEFLREGSAVARLHAPGPRGARLRPTPRPPSAVAEPVPRRCSADR